MARFCCENCGTGFSTLTPIKAQNSYCNLGCAVRGRVPVDADGNFPVNRPLVAVAVVGFLFFNQLLTAGFSVGLAHRDRAEPAIRLAWISWAMGIFIWFATIVLQRLQGVSRRRDHVFGGLIFLILLLAMWRTEPRVGLSAAAVGSLLIWNFRGLLRSGKAG